MTHIKLQEACKISQFYGIEVHNVRNFRAKMNIKKFPLVRKHFQSYRLLVQKVRSSWSPNALLMKVQFLNDFTNILDETTDKDPNLLVAL